MPSSTARCRDRARRDQVGRRARPRRHDHRASAASDRLIRRRPSRRCPAARRLGRRRTAVLGHRHREFRPGRPRSAACRLRLRHDDAEAWLGEHRRTRPLRRALRRADRVRHRRQRRGARRGALGRRPWLRGAHLHHDRDRDRRWSRHRRSPRARRSSIPSTDTSACAAAATTPSPGSAPTTATASRASRRDRRSPPAPGPSPERLGPDHPVWTDVAAEIGEMMAVLVLSISPQRIVLGGGVGNGLPWLLPRVRKSTLYGARRLRRRLSTTGASTRLIVAPALGDDAGPLGAVAIGLGASPTPRRNERGLDAAENAIAESAARSAAIEAGRSRSPSSSASPSTGSEGFYTRAAAGEPAAAAPRSSPRRRSGRCSAPCSPATSTPTWDELGRPAVFTVVDAGAGPGTLARTILAARPACLAAVRYVAVELSAAQRTLHPAGVESRADLPEGPFDGVIVANELLDNLPFRLCVFDGAWREAFVVGHQRNVQRSAVGTVRPGPPSLAAGAGARLAGAAARRRRRLGRRRQVTPRPGPAARRRLRAADDLLAGRPAVAGVAAHLPRPRTRRSLPHRAGQPGHHRRARHRPVPAARRREHAGAVPSAMGHRRTRRRRRHGVGCHRRRAQTCGAWRCAVAPSRRQALLDPAGLGAFSTLEWSQP